MQVKFWIVSKSMAGMVTPLCINSSAQNHAQLLAEISGWLARGYYLDRIEQL